MTVQQISDINFLCVRAAGSHSCSPLREKHEAKCSLLRCTCFDLAYLHNTLTTVQIFVLKLKI